MSGKAKEKNCKWLRGRGREKRYIKYDAKDKKRYHMLDGIRGLTFVSMFVYHGMWDLVWLFQKDIGWYVSTAGYVWQQSICIAFILLSGFSWSFGRRKYCRGLEILAAGIMITLVTVFFMPGDRVVFGVLTFLGAAVLCMIPLEFFLRKCKPEPGLAVSLLLFFLTRNVNRGCLGYEGMVLGQLPSGLYRNLITTFLGFPEPGFFSTDYFSLLPWIFLYVAGYYLCRTAEKRSWLSYLEKSICPLLEKAGRHTLLLYMIHQPLLYGALSLIFA